MEGFSFPVSNLRALEFEKLKVDVLKLSWRQRLELAQHLLQSLHDPPSEPEPKKVSLDHSIGESFQKLREALETSLNQVE